MQRGRPRDVFLGEWKGDSPRGNVEWFQYSLDMNMFLQIQFQSGVKRNAVWNDLRGPTQTNAFVPTHLHVETFRIDLFSLSSSRVLLEV